MERIPCFLTHIYMMLFKWRRKIKNHLNSILIMPYKFPSNLHISPIFNGVSMQLESKWNTEGRQFKWSLLNTTIETIYHKSMERNLKRILKNILFKCKWNWFKMHFFLLRVHFQCKSLHEILQFYCSSWPNEHSNGLANITMASDQHKKNWDIIWSSI